MTNTNQPLTDQPLTDHQIASRSCDDEVDGPSGSGRLIALEGIDGAGKTTLSERVALTMADLRVNSQDTKEVAVTPSYAQRSMASVAELLRPKADEAFEHHLGPHYWLYLQALHFTLLSQFVVAGKLATRTHLVADGWYYKFYAKLRLRGFDAGFLDDVFRASIKPDLVILLDPDVRAVWERRTFAPREMGLHGNYGVLNRESFIDYQSRVRAALRDLAQNDRGWVTIRVDGSDGCERTAEQVTEIIREFLGAERTVDRAIT